MFVVVGTFISTSIVGIFACVSKIMGNIPSETSKTCAYYTQQF
jgi:hypothetical protein